MLTVQSGGSGLGLFIQGSGKSLRFSHDGRDEGFDSFMVAYAKSGQGMVIMINANENSGVLVRIVDAVREEYHWPEAGDE